MTRARLEAIAKANPQGFTANRKGQVFPEHGYAVAYGESLTFAEASRLLNSRFGPEYVGGWRDPETEKYMIERTVIFGERADTEAMARAWRQKAFYGFAEKETIYV